MIKLKKSNNFNERWMGCKKDKMQTATFGICLDCTTQRTGSFAPADSTGLLSSKLFPFLSLTERYLQKRSWSQRCLKRGHLKRPKDKIWDIREGGVQVNPQILPSHISSSLYRTIQHWHPPPLSPWELCTLLSLSLWSPAWSLPSLLLSVFCMTIILPSPWPRTMLAWLGFNVF